MTVSPPYAIKLAASCNNFNHSLIDWNILGSGEERQKTTYLVVETIKWDTTHRFVADDHGLYTIGGIENNSEVLKNVILIN